MASNLTVDTLTKGATTLNTDELVDVNNTRVAKAWVNFNGTGTVAIRASYNISSITDHATGQYTVNFTNAMANANYMSAGMAGGDYNNLMNVVQPTTDYAPTTTSCRYSTLYVNTTLYDAQYIGIAIYTS